ncbi:hypothetical protein EK904_002030, partial [Melospiza melodia maxima]
MDISPAMLDVAVEREVEGDLLLADVGHGIPFRPGMFDGCIRPEDPELCCSCTPRTQSRFFLCLFVGTSGTLPKGLGTECASEEPQQAKFTNERYPG